MKQGKFKETEIDLSAPKTKLRQAGKIPEGWEVKRVVDCIELIYGKGLPKRERRSGNIHVFGSNGIVGFHNEMLVKGPGIIIGRKGSVGEINFSKKDFWPIDTTYYVRTKQRNDIAFWYYFLNTLGLNQMNSHSAVPGLNRDNVYGITVLLPSLPEQRDIAKILSDLDDKIELNQQMNKTLEKIGQAFFKHWFVDFEFRFDSAQGKPNEEGKPYKSSGGEMVDSEPGEIPRGWRISRLSEVLSSLESGSRPKGGVSSYSEGVSSIGAENILGLGKYDYSKTKYVPLEFFEKTKSGKIEDGDVLLYKDGAQLGRKSFFMCSFPFNKCCINEHVFILRTNELVCPIYLYFWLDQLWMTEEIKNLNTNSAQPGINQEGVNSLKVLIPNRNIIKEFDRIITPLISHIFENCLQNYDLSQIRDSLLPRLMSGRIRVGMNL